MRGGERTYGEIAQTSAKSRRQGADGNDALENGQCNRADGVGSARNQSHGLTTVIEGTDIPDWILGCQKLAQRDAVNERSPGIARLHGPKSKCALAGVGFISLPSQQGPVTQDERWTFKVLVNETCTQPEFTGSSLDIRQPRRPTRLNRGLSEGSGCLLLPAGPSSRRHR